MAKGYEKQAAACLCQVEMWSHGHTPPATMAQGHLLPVRGYRLTVDPSLGAGTHSHLSRGIVPTGLHSLAIRSDRKESFLTCLNIGRELAKLNVSVVSKGLFQKLTPAHFFLIIHRPSKDNVRVEGQEVAGECSLLKHPPWICVQRQL